MPRGGARQGAGRKATGREYLNKSVTLHKDHWAELEKLATEARVSVTRYAADILRWELTHQKYKQWKSW